MKLSFNKASGEFQVTNKGKVVDHDTDFDALATRNGFFEISADEMDSPSADLMTPTYKNQGLNLS